MQWNSRDYWAGIELRNDLLKKNSGQKQLTSAPLDEQNDLHLTVRRDGKVVGTLLMHPIDQKMIQVKQVAIASCCQGLGIGKQLLRYAEKLAAVMNYKIIFLTGRKQAWSFYEKLDYMSVLDSYVDGQIELKLFKKELNVENGFITNEVREMKTNGRQ
ncbi:hypothetical protein A5888_002369 [Enterococcus sp. 9E7_DIV0242]|uniref:N-acetyltransferase domain-containing protein n=1 Tax=Candidatus Enterococcus clewellii TaxID=1834193 RepID=A0AAQ3Y0S8_9ENTE|nr:GNAT family N-acetyltransferase [Enterococcus sp. 9E7_DIV0242]